MMCDQRVGVLITNDTRHGVSVHSLLSFLNGDLTEHVTVGPWNLGYNFYSWHDSRFLDAAVLLRTCQSFFAECTAPKSLLRV